MIGLYDVGFPVAAFYPKFRLLRRASRRPRRHPQARRSRRRRPERDRGGGEVSVSPGDRRPPLGESLAEPLKSLGEVRLGNWEARRGFPEADRISSPFRLRPTRAWRIPSPRPPPISAGGATLSRLTSDGPGGPANAVVGPFHRGGVQTNETLWSTGRTSSGLAVDHRAGLGGFSASAKAEKPDMTRLETPLRSPRPKAEGRPYARPGRLMAHGRLRRLATVNAYARINEFCLTILVPCNIQIFG